MKPFFLLEFSSRDILRLQGGDGKGNGSCAMWLPLKSEMVKAFD